jgi:hypothetical protein
MRELLKILDVTTNYHEIIPDSSTSLGRPVKRRKTTQSTPPESRTTKQIEGIIGKLTPGEKCYISVGPSSDAEISVTSDQNTKKRKLSVPFENFTYLVIAYCNEKNEKKCLILNVFGHDNFPGSELLNSIAHTRIVTWNIWPTIYKDHFSHGSVTNAMFSTLALWCKIIDGISAQDLACYTKDPKHLKKNKDGKKHLLLKELIKARLDKEKDAALKALFEFIYEHTYESHAEAIFDTQKEIINELYAMLRSFNMGSEMGVDDDEAEAAPPSLEQQLLDAKHQLTQVTAKLELLQKKLVEQSKTKFDYVQTLARNSQLERELTGVKNQLSRAKEENSKLIDSALQPIELTPEQLAVMQNMAPTSTTASASHSSTVSYPALFPPTPAIPPAPSLSELTSSKSPPLPMSDQELEAIIIATVNHPPFSPGS